MNYKTEKDEESGMFIASTNDYPGTFYGYGKTEKAAIKDLKEEVQFALNGGYKKT